MTSTSARSRPSSGASPTRLMLVLGSLPAAGVTVLGALLGWLVQGAAVGLSVLVGGVLALLIFALGAVAIRGLLNGPNQVVMAGAFGILLLQMVLIAGLLLLVVQVEWLSVPGLGIGFLLSGLVFQAGAVIAALRARVTVEPAVGSGSRASVRPEEVR